MKKIIICLAVCTISFSLNSCNKQIDLSYLETSEYTTATVAGDKVETKDVANEDRTTQQEAGNAEASMPNATDAPSGRSDTPTNQTNTEQFETSSPPVNPGGTSAVHQHAYTSTVVAPTCTAGGYTRFVCSCGHSYDADQVPARGHLYGNWETTVQPTTSTTGEKQCVCSRCGHVLSEVVPKLSTGTQNQYENYIDPRIEIKIFNNVYSYYYGGVSVTDARSWGNPPYISITDTGGFTVIYCKQDGTIVTIPVVPLDGYINRCVLLDDGNYTIHPIGDYKD